MTYAYRRVFWERGRTPSNEFCSSSTTEFGTFPVRDRGAMDTSEPYRRCNVHAFLCLIALSFLAVTAFSAACGGEGSFQFGSTERVQRQAKKTCRTPQTILISIDGFRFDYLHRRYNQARDGKSTLIAPTLVKIAEEGAFSNRGMVPVMPSITFPNHWSLITGLYPESSGIVHNIMYDTVRKKLFAYSDDDPTWWKGEPFWKTVSRTKRRSMAPGTTANYNSAAVFWPGSSVPTLSADAFWMYNGSIPYEDRVNRLVSLLKGTAEDLKGKPADFVTLYFEGVDGAGHFAGPNSKLVDMEIARVEKTLVYLFQKLGPNYAEKYNVIILSDHGMAETRPELVIDLDAIVPNGTLQDVVSTPFGMFINIGVSAESVYRIIRRGLRRYAPHAKVFLRKNLPERWHVKLANVMTPIVTLASPGFMFRFKRKSLVTVRQTANQIRGAHGYEHTLPVMRSIFMAIGPSFKKRSRIPILQAVDVYPMLCSIFGAHPAPNNGSIGATRPLLSKCARQM